MNGSDVQKRVGATLVLLFAIINVIVESNAIYNWKNRICGSRRVQSTLVEGVETRPCLGTKSFLSYGEPDRTDKGSCVYGLQEITILFNFVHIAWHYGCLLPMHLIDSFLDCRL
jgi:hypothetical protein